MTAKEFLQSPETKRERIIARRQALGEVFEVLKWLPVIAALGLILGTIFTILRCG